MSISDQPMCKILRAAIPFPPAFQHVPSRTWAERHRHFRRRGVRNEPDSRWPSLRRAPRGPPGGGPAAVRKARFAARATWALQCCRGWTERAERRLKSLTILTIQGMSGTLLIQGMSGNNNVTQPPSHEAQGPGADVSLSGDRCWRADPGTRAGQPLRSAAPQAYAPPNPWHRCRCERLCCRASSKG